MKNFGLIAATILGGGGGEGVFDDRGYTPTRPPQTPEDKQALLDAAQAKRDRRAEKRRKLLERQAAKEPKC